MLSKSTHTHQITMKTVTRIMLKLLARFKFSDRQTEGQTRNNMLLVMLQLGSKKVWGNLHVASLPNKLCVSEPRPVFIFTFLQDLSAQNCWNTSRMWMSMSLVNSKLSNVLMYLNTNVWCWKRNHIPFYIQSWTGICILLKIITYVFSGSDNFSTWKRSKGVYHKWLNKTGLDPMIFPQ